MIFICYVHWHVAEGGVAPEQGTGGRVLQRARARFVLSPVHRPHVRRAGDRVRAVQKELRGRMAAADRAGGRAGRETGLSGQPAGHLRQDIKDGPDAQRVPRQRLAGRRQKGNPFLLPEQYVRSRRRVRPPHP